MKVTYVLIALCVLVFVLEQAAPDAVYPQVTLTPISLLSAPWTVITSMFGHADLEHILFNMIALFMFGSVLENRIGSGKFVLVYFVSGVLGSIGFMLFNSPFGSALGASGAIYGIIGALVLLEPNLTVYFYFMPLPMYVVGPIYALIELFYLGSADAIAHSAHLLGFFGGLALAFREGKAGWPPKPPMEMWKALAIPIALSLVVAIGFGAYYLSDQLNVKILNCMNAESVSAARACLMDLSKEYKNSPQQQAYVCSAYAEFFADGACRGA
jgi:membrane associated rhomboid family serine protease